MDLDCLKLRDLLNAENAPPEKLMSLGRDLAMAGHLSDAVDFLDRAGDHEGLSRLGPVAVDEGDFFLFRKINRSLGRQIKTEEYRLLAERAEELGKHAFAQWARNRLDDAG